MTDPSNTVKPLVKTPGLLRSTGIVSSMTLLSRVLGFIRDIVIALFFGTIAAVDAFFVAFKIPNLMRRLFAEGAFSQAFVPILAELQQKTSHEYVRLFVSRVSGTLGSVLFLITVIAMLASPWLTVIFAPGFGTESIRYEMATEMLRLTFPYLLFISLTAMAGAVLNTYGYFAIPAFTPVFLNISLIVCAIYLAPSLANPVEALAWGVLFAGMIQLIFQLPFLARINMLTIPQYAAKDSEVLRVCKLMVPALFGVSVAQINILLDMIFASFLPIGSISWLYFSDRLTNFPLGVFAVAIATVIMPQLSRDHANASLQQFSKNLDWALRLILLIAMPATIGLVLLAGPLLATLLGYGEFTDRDVFMARLSLTALSFGVPAFMLIKILASGFYAQQNIRTPVKIGIIAMVCNTVLNLLLITPFKHMGLALATSLAAFLNAGLLFYYLRKYAIYHIQTGWIHYALRLIFANSLMAVSIYLISQPVAIWLTWGPVERALQLFMIIVISVVIYLLSLRLTGLKMKDFSRAA